MLNPKSISVAVSDATLATAAQNLDAAIVTAVATATAATTAANQVEIIPLGTIYDVTNAVYVCSACVVYPS